MKKEGKKEENTLKNSNKVDMFPIDCFSLGHIIMGIITFIISSIIFLSLDLDTTWRELSLISTIGVAWFWEILENAYLLKYKYRQRQDSLFNSLLDILFCAIGGILQMVLSFVSNFIIYIIITTNIITVMLAVYFLLRQKMLQGEETKMRILLKKVTGYNFLSKKTIAIKKS